MKPTPGRSAVRLPPGDYIIFAGTNFDRDGFIGDAGESSGAYLALDQPVVVSVQQDGSGFNFVTEFNTRLTQIRTSAPNETFFELPE